MSAWLVFLDDVVSDASVLALALNKGEVGDEDE
jgi:hypothetical protein